MSRPTRVLYLDLDGTVRHGKDELGFFVNKREDVHVFDGVPELMQKYKDDGFRIVAITNQGGVALGHMSFQVAEETIMETYSQCNKLFDKMMMCVHHPDAKDPEMAVCWCRKPRIGNIVTAASKMGMEHDEYYPPHLALFVGDRPEDRECAESAGIKFMDAKEWRAQALHAKPNQEEV
jgi:D-glycero-D-manno-heptose 1,7-bisphosphate phosphatase